MKILTEHSGRNKHGQALARVQCDCGRIFEPLENNIKRGRTKSCGHCTDPAPIATPVTVAKVEPDIAFGLEYGSVAWLNAHIESKIAAARSADSRLKELQDSLAVAEMTDLTLLKCWTAESAAFEKLTQQIARLQMQKDKLETGTVKSDKTQAEITRDKIAALRGSK
jgi:hypothetical protein